MNRTNWMGFHEWEQLGLSIKSTSSVDAVKLYDAAVSQFAGWYDDSNLGGLETTLNKLYEADPDFVLGNALILCIDLIGFSKTYHYDEDIKQRIDNLQELVHRKQAILTDRERKHVQALVCMSKMDWIQAGHLWADIVDQHPNDMHATKMAFYMFLFNGKKESNLNMMAKVYSHNDLAENVYSEFIPGLYAFTLEESGSFIEAEKYACLGLELNPHDGWTTHAMSHVLEMTGRFEEGSSFLSGTVRNWTKANMLSCHNYWHWALFEMESHKYEQALQVFDDHILPRVNETQTTFSVTDASSLLYRLSLSNAESIKKDELDSRFHKVQTVCRQYLNKHVLGFLDAHYMMACLGSGQMDSAQELLRSQGQGDTGQLTKQLLQAMLDYHRENYGRAADGLRAIQNDLVRLGGSDAQRQVFQQLLTVATLKSKVK